MSQTMKNVHVAVEGSTNSLEHYGRKGMKWYQHIFTDDSEGNKVAKDSDVKKLETKLRTGQVDSPASTKPGEKPERTESISVDAGEVKYGTSQSTFDKYAAEAFSKNPTADRISFKVTADGDNFVINYEWDKNTNKPVYIETVRHQTITLKETSGAPSSGSSAPSEETSKSGRQDMGEIGTSPDQKKFDAIAEEWFKKNPDGKSFFFHCTVNGEPHTIWYKKDSETGKVYFDSIWSHQSSGRLTHMEKGKDYLEHYGIKGMKWGVRRSPEQLGHKTASKKRSNQSRNLQKARKAKAAKAKKAAADDKKREEYLKSPTQLYKHRDMFTQQEIDAAMKRFQWEQNLRNMSKNEMNRGKETVDMILGYTKTATDAYNQFAKIYNTYQSYNKTENRLPIVGEQEKKDQNAKKGNK